KKRKAKRSPAWRDLVQPATKSRMVRARRAASSVAIAIVCALFHPACGSDDPEGDGGGSSSGTLGGDASTPPPDTAPAKTCATDGDCPNGGKCKDVGAPTKSCVYAKSCTGGAGADAKCGEGKDCCDTRAVPGGTFNRFND